MDAPFTPNRGGVLYITSICFTLDEDVDFNKPANCSAVIELLRPLIRIEVEGVPIIDTLSPSFCIPGNSLSHQKRYRTGLSFTRFGMSYCNLPSDTFTSGVPLLQTPPEDLRLYCRSRRCVSFPLRSAPIQVLALPEKRSTNNDRNASSYYFFL